MIDGAKVLYWAWSHPRPFFIMTSTDGAVSVSIHGLAICQYDDGQTYRFSCNDKWETENDSDFDNPEEAMTSRSGQYDILKVKWQTR